MGKVAFNPEELKLSDRLAVERTLMAADRTLLAWVRTSLSLIGFGFTIYKLLQYAYDQGQTSLMRPETPRNIGLLLLFTGTAPLISIMMEYIRTLKRMGRRDNIFLTPNFVTAVIVFLLGATLIITVLARIALL
jgi:putative membrane protein